MGGSITQYENLSNFTGEKSTFIISDSTKLILGDTCKLVNVNWGNYGDEFYWYDSKKLKINPELYKSHQFENLDKILQISDGSYPIEIIKTVGKHILIQMTLKEVNEISIPESNFSIPELKELSKKEMKNSPTIKGVKFMKKKN